MSEFKIQDQVLMADPSPMPGLGFIVKSSPRPYEVTFFSGDGAGQRLSNEILLLRYIFYVLHREEFTVMSNHYYEFLTLRRLCRLCVVTNTLVMATLVTYANYVRDRVVFLFITVARSEVRDDVSLYSFYLASVAADEAIPELFQSAVSTEC